MANSARARLIAELRTHALVVGEVVLTSGRTAQYYVDAKRAILRPAGFEALGELVAERAREVGATAVGGLTMGADPVACAALAGGADVKAFFVRKDRKAHGLQRSIEGPPLEDGERCLIVEDVVTTGGSTIQAIEAVRRAGHQVCAVTAVLDRLAGAAEAIEAAADAPFRPLTTIDDVYPERPDREYGPGWRRTGAGAPGAAPTPRDVRQRVRRPSRGRPPRARPPRGRPSRAPDRPRGSARG
jgi:orotate phosphoribosyltransferase